MALLRPSTRPRASAELGYRMLAGLVAGGAAELLGVTLAQERNPQQPDYLVPSLVAAGVGLLTAILDPPSGGITGAAWIDPDGNVIDVPRSHALTAATLVPLDAATVAEELPRYEHCRGWDQPQACIAQRILAGRGWVRVDRRFGTLNIEMFRPLTDAQEDVLYRTVGGDSTYKPLEIDVSDPQTGANRRNFSVTMGSPEDRYEALERASAAA